MATLNLHNPEGLYSGGSVNINALPYARMAMDARDRKQAREDAIDKYYRTLPDTINDKGVRDQEIPIINEYKNKIFEYGQKNKEALRNPKIDNGAAQFGLQKIIRDASGVARLSQDASKEDLEIGKLWLNKDSRWVVDDDEFIAANQRHNLPVTDPNFKKVDIPLILQGRPFDQTSFRKELKDFKYSEGEPKITPHPTDKMMEVVTSNPIIGEDTKASIYNFSADKYHSNRSFRKKIESDLAQTGQLPVLQDLFQKTFGKPIETDEDIAAAYTISQLPTSQTRAKVIPNKDAVMDRQKADAKDRALFNDKLIRGRMRQAQDYKIAYKDYTSAKDAGQEEAILNKFIKNSYDNSEQTTSAYIGGKDYKGRLIDLPKEIKDKYIVDKGYDTESVPDTWLLTDDMKTLVPMFYGEKTASGGHELKANKNSKPIDIQNFKVDLGKLLLTQKQRGGEVIDQFEVQQPASKPKPKSNPLGLKF